MKAFFKAMAMGGICLTMAHGSLFYQEKEYHWHGYFHANATQKGTLIDPKILKEVWGWSDQDLAKAGYFPNEASCKKYTGKTDQFFIPKPQVPYETVAQALVGKPKAKTLVFGVGYNEEKVLGNYGTPRPLNLFTKECIKNPGDYILAEADWQIDPDVYANVFDKNTFRAVKDGSLDEVRLQHVDAGLPIDWEHIAYRYCYEHYESQLPSQVFLKKKSYAAGPQGKKLLMKEPQGDQNYTDVLAEWARVLKPEGCLTYFSGVFCPGHFDQADLKTRSPGDGRLACVMDIRYLSFSYSKHVLVTPVKNLSDLKTVYMRLLEPYGFSDVNVVLEEEIGYEDYILENQKVATGDINYTGDKDVDTAYTLAVTARKKK
jgi:hypothetical protein